MITIKAYAKVNLFLEVIGKRSDGYHDIITVFARVGIYDLLHFQKNNGYGIRVFIKNNVNMPDIDLKDNLVWKAVKRFEERFGVKCSCDIHIEKNIPVGSGLGGGSSDCASTLLTLCEMYGIPKEEIYSLASELGSDVAFFTRNSMLCIAKGRGEILEDITLKATLPEVIIAFPNIHLSTARVYSSLTLRHKADLERFNMMVDALRKEGSVDFSNILFNRLEEPAFVIEPEVKKLKKRMSDIGLVSLMSGSGSSVFGLSYSHDVIDKAYNLLKSNCGFIFKTKFV